MVPPEGRKFCTSFYDPGRAVKPPLVPFARAGYQLSTVTDVGARRKRQLLGPGRDPGGDRLGIASPGEDHNDRPSETSVIPAMGNLDRWGGFALGVEERAGTFRARN